MSARRCAPFIKSRFGKRYILLFEREKKKEVAQLFSFRVLFTSNFFPSFYARSKALGNIFEYYYFRVRFARFPADTGTELCYRGRSWHINFYRRIRASRFSKPSFSQIWATQLSGPLLIAVFFCCSCHRFFFFKNRKTLKKKKD